MDFKKLTEKIAILEGKRIQVNIAQIKEISKIILTELANLPIIELAGIFKKYQKKNIVTKNAGKKK